MKGGNAAILLMLILTTTLRTVRTSPVQVDEIGASEGELVIRGEDFGVVVETGETHLEEEEEGAFYGWFRFTNQ